MPGGRPWLAAICAFCFLAAIVVAVAILESNRSGTSAEKKKEQTTVQSGPRDASSGKTTADKTASNQFRALIDKDFRAAFVNKLTLPDGWEGDAFRVVQIGELFGVEVSRPSGVHSITLPPIILSKYRRSRYGPP